MRYKLGQLRTFMGAPEGMMLAARLLCSGERPDSLQNLFQAACRFRLSAKDGASLLGLPFISRNLRQSPVQCQDVDLSSHSAIALKKINFNSGP